MKSLSEFLKTTIVGRALYSVPIALILVVLGKVHAIMSKLVAPMAQQLEFHDVGGIAVARLLAIAGVVLGRTVPHAGCRARTHRGQLATRRFSYPGRRTPSPVPST